MPVGVGAKPAGGAARPAAPAKPAAPPSAPPAGAEGKKGGKLKLIIIIAVVLVLLVSLAVGTLFLLKALGILGGGGNEGGEAEAKPTPTSAKMGTVTVATGEPINVNLADGYLSFAATIYFDETVTADGHGGGEIDPSPARAAALNLFKGMKMEALNKPGAVKELEKKYMALLNKELIPPYDGHVVQVRFTTFAYQ